MVITGGYTNYGQEIGILMLDTLFPRIVGDIGNACTFSFPVRYKVVSQAYPDRVVMQNDPALLDRFIAAAQELQAEGVKAITTSCGFLAVYQRELTQAVAVPVFTSSLLQVPVVQRMLGPGKQPVIVTAHSGKLSERHLLGAGITDKDIPVVGLETKQEFAAVFLGNKRYMDVSLLEKEMNQAAEFIKCTYPNAGALVLECTNLPPFRQIFKSVTGLPVFDIVTLVNTVHASLV